MKEVLSCKVTPDEKHLVQAWAARRGESVAHVVRSCVLKGMREELGIRDVAVEDVSPAAERSGNL